MNEKRRDVLKAIGGAGIFGALISAGMITPAMVHAADARKVFTAKTLDEAFAALGTPRPAESADITITAPDIAENGAVVPVGVASKIPNTEQVAILVEKNPNMVAATFAFGENAFGENTLPDLQTRIKMGQTSDVYALVKADGKFYMAKKEVKVTLGGCGG